MTEIEAKLAEADRNVLAAFALVRSKASSVNYRVGTWLSDVDPLAELAQFERRHLEWRGRAASAFDAETANRLVASANENARGAASLVGIASEITLTRAISSTAAATAATLEDAARKAVSWGSWALPLFAVVAGIFGLSRLVSKVKE